MVLSFSNHLNITLKNLSGVKRDTFYLCIGLKDNYSFSSKIVSVAVYLPMITASVMTNRRTGNQKTHNTIRRKRLNIVV